MQFATVLVAALTAAIASAAPATTNAERATCKYSILSGSNNALYFCQDGQTPFLNPFNGDGGAFCCDGCPTTNVLMKTAGEFYISAFDCGCRKMCATGATPAKVDMPATTTSVRPKWPVVTL